MNDFFVAMLGVVLAGAMGWGFRRLPDERWQMLAAVPLRKQENGSWTGMNLTYYGVISALAYALALSVIILLMGSCGIPLSRQLLFVVPVLCVAIPSAKILAMIVEKKSGTFTVGGASFAAILVAPWVVAGINAMSAQAVPMVAVLAAFSIAYTLGEALGRLACISFGCCYGKPLGHSGRFMNRVFSRFFFIFTGKTKKIAYAAGLDGEKMLPIQAVTSVVYTLAGLAGTALFLHGHARAALILTIAVTQVWRVISEFFRTDFRGALTFSAYQIMALVGVVYMTGIGCFVQVEPAMPLPDIALGFAALWQPGALLLVQGFWGLAFLYTGRSVVTGSCITFHIVEDRI